MTKNEKLKHCIGCHNDYYNGRERCGGRDCWHLSGANLVLRRRVHMDDMPPHTHKPQQFFNCRYEPGYSFHDVEITR